MKGDMIKEIPEEIKEFLQLPEGVVKNIKAQEFLHRHFNVIGGLKSEGQVSFYSHMLKLRQGTNSYFLSPVTKSGLTFKDNKLSIWFSKGTKEVVHGDFYIELFNYMGWNFIDTKSDYVRMYITKGILEKLFKGKITNTRDLLKEYAKVNRIKVSTELFYTAVTKVGLSKPQFLYYASSAKNVDHFLEWFMKLGDSKKDWDDFRHADPETSMRDLCKQYKILNKKIDFTWSDKRVELEHTLATREIMSYKSQSMSDEVIKYPDYGYPKEFTLLDTEKKVYYEGTTMAHCLYTNYWESIRNKTYLAFHVSLNGEEATLGVHTRIFRLDQIHTKGNRGCSPEMRKFCSDWVESYSKDKVVTVGGIF